jgi:hypothetical protein
VLVLHTSEYCHKEALAVILIIPCYTCFRVSVLHLLWWRTLQLTPTFCLVHLCLCIHLAQFHKVQVPTSQLKVWPILIYFQNNYRSATKVSQLMKKIWEVWYRSHLGGVVVSVLATGPKGHGFEPGQGGGFLRVIKIRSTPSFVWKVKLEVPCRKILRHVKDLLKSHGDR